MVIVLWKWQEVLRGVSPCPLVFNDSSSWSQKGIWHYSRGVFWLNNVKVNSEHRGKLTWGDCTTYFWLRPPVFAVLQESIDNWSSARNEYFGWPWIGMAKAKKNETQQRDFAWSSPQTSLGVYIFLFDPPPGGGQKYGEITCWGKKMIEREWKRGVNAYFFPNWWKICIFFPQLD